LTADISETVQNFAKTLSSAVGPLGALQKPSTIAGVAVTFFARNNSKKSL